VCAMGWMLHSTRTVLAVSWLPRCPGGERLNTSGLLLLPPLCTPLLLRQTSSHPPRLLLIGWNGLMLLIHVHKVLGQRQQRRPPLFDSNGSSPSLQGIPTRMRLSALLHFLPESAKKPGSELPRETPDGELDRKHTRDSRYAGSFTILYCDK